jgi:TPR repeat protein
MSTNDTCANCGKGEESSGDNLKACTACKLVKYCNRECQIAHRPQHKKECKKRAAELYDELLFKKPPPPEDCPICMLPPPLYEDHTGITFYACCGKNICNGCECAMVESGEKDICPFCRTPPAKSEEEDVERVMKQTEKSNAHAFHTLAGLYDDGTYGLPQDGAKANELWLKAGELGCAEAYYNFGINYRTGNGVEIDERKAKHYYELAAMNGSVQARNNLGCMEGQAGNHHRAMKHFIISAKAGLTKSLDCVKHGFMNGHVTKDQYANTLREYQHSQNEMKSEARDKAMAARNSNNIHG